MTDSLRDRITAALRNMTGDLTYEAMADAVIRELGNLRQEPHRFQCGSDGCSRYRIISDWTTDD